MGKRNHRNRDSSGRFAPTSFSVSAGRSPLQSAANENRDAARREVAGIAQDFAGLSPEGLSVRARSKWIADQVEEWASEKPGVLAAYEDGVSANPLNNVRADVGFALSTAA